MNQVCFGQPAHVLSDRMVPVRRFLRSPGGLLLLLLLATRVRGGDVDSATALVRDWRF